MLVRKGGAIYILTNYANTTLYVGVTSDLPNRIIKHKNCYYPRSFSARYKLFKLVHFELFGSIGEAIAREKQIKKYKRDKKIQLVNSLNPEWDDLWNEVSNW